MAEPVYIVTLKLDAASSETLGGLRERYFPPERNWLPAHLTLLHTVFSGQRAALLAARATFANCAPPPLNYAGVRFLGRGVAIEVHSPPAGALRSTLMATLGGTFSRQDQQAFRAHVTVQNKVAPEVARETYETLRTGFVPWTGQGTGLQLWRYLGGPWEFDSEIVFSG